MKRQKKTRDGIQLYAQPEPKNHSSKRNNHPFLLTAVQLLAVWLLAVSWWQNLASVFPVPADRLRLYTVFFLLAAVLSLLWNLPLKPLIKGIIFALLCGFAGFWIWRHLPAAVNVLNYTANAYLSVCRPDAFPYPIQPVSDARMAVMFGLFLVPLLTVWSLILHTRRGKIFSLFLLLAPAALALILAQVPSESSCWLVILSGTVYCTICGSREGRAALTEGLAAAGVLSLLILLSASGSRPLEPCKQPPDSFYARTRASIETDWIRPFQASLEQARTDTQARIQRRKQEKEEEAADRNNAQTAEDPTQSDADAQDVSPDGADAQNSTQDDTSVQDPSQNNTDAQNPSMNLTVEPAEGADHIPLFPMESNTDITGNISGTGLPGNSGGTADRLPDLKALSCFQPDGGTRLTITLDTRPETTVYYPAAYGVLYQDSHWMELPSAVPEDSSYLQTPESLGQLETLCRQNPLQTLSEVSDFIQKEFEENTVYDYEPGPTPADQDFAEYFLFENRRGFCVHFATTAALMYRICGYPSRYVQGYAIPASAFHRQEDGSYAAEATGEMGHAWCEVYSDGEWILKEHTLPYRGVRPESGIPAVTAPDGTSGEPVGFETSRESARIPSSSSQERPWIRNAAGWGLLALELGAESCVFLLAAALILFAQASLRRQRRYQSFRKLHKGAGIRRIYCAIYDEAVFAKMQKTDILSLQGFRMLRGHFAEMPGDEMEWLYRTILETMFSERTVTREETRHAWQIYQQCSSVVIKNLSPRRRFIYRYIKAF